SPQQRALRRAEPSLRGAARSLQAAPLHRLQLHRTQRPHRVPAHSVRAGDREGLGRVRQGHQHERLVHDMTTQTQQTQATKYFLYIPVWATTQQPSGSESASQSGPSQSTESASSVMSSDDLPSGSET